MFYLLFSVRTPRFIQPTKDKRTSVRERWGKVVCETELYVFNVVLLEKQETTVQGQVSYSCPFCTLSHSRPRNKGPKGEVLVKNDSRWKFSTSKRVPRRSVRRDEDPKSLLGKKYEKFGLLRERWQWSKSHDNWEMVLGKWLEGVWKGHTQSIHEGWLNVQIKKSIRLYGLREVIMFTKFIIDIVLIWQLLFINKN